MFALDSSISRGKKTNGGNTGSIGSALILMQRLSNPPEISRFFFFLDQIPQRATRFLF